ncbi:MAG: radical SAM family heme chaperone HemW [Bacteroidales bacterium]|jgi:oxygen-independent coproporphyrinogen-3 oxidase|nr:radical SAM family heme chaperone HemW [Bacteroidales bacterium]
MAGLYIHIPFCKRKCHYCNFYSLAKAKFKPELVQALVKEMELQRNYLHGEKLESIYFGGGTPSMLNEHELQFIFEKIYTAFNVEEKAEITFEANPDDLSKDYLQMLKKSPVNRLSIGVQSFNDEELVYLNRLHSAEEAISALKRAQDVGFSSLSLDLIYGIPIATNESWLKNLNQFKELQVDHLSAYNLTREENTAYDLFIKKGKYAPPNDVQGQEHFNLLLDFTRENKLEQYEVSNFAFDQKYAIHNTNYWHRKKYLGIGPSAHSFDLLSRSWNIAQLKPYIDSINNELVPHETELLNKSDKWNETIMTGLRTKWGVEIEYLKQNFEADWLDTFNQQAQKYIQNKQLLKSETHFQLSKNGLFFADGIAADFFRVNE